MQNCHFINFDITIRGTQAPYGVTAHFTGSVAEGTFDQAATQPYWQELSADLAHMTVDPGNRRIVEAGALLFGALVKDDIRQLWVRALASLTEPEVSGLRIRLALHAPEVAGLPWECLTDPDRRELFAAGGRTLLVRIENQERYLTSPRTLRTTLPISVLLVAPEDPSGVIQAAQAQQVIDHLRSFGSHLVDVRAVRGRFSLLDVSHALEETAADIVHIITHGDSEGLLLWQDDMPTFAPAHVLRVALERTRHVKFVFLNACLTGQSVGQAPLAAVGPQLLQTGIPAVIAMQYEIRNDDAAEFSHFLYEGLLTGPCPGAIDAAMGYARSNLYMRHPDRFAFGTPILWMNAHDGQIVQLSQSARQALSAIPRSPLPSTDASMAQADATGPHTEGRLVGPIGEVEEGGQLASEGGAPAAMKPVDWQQYRTWLADKEAEIERCHHSPDWRLLRFEWHSVTRDLADTIQRLERMNSESPEAFHGQPFQGTLAHLNHLQRQIDALIETICAPEDRGSPESDTQA